MGRHVFSVLVSLAPVLGTHDALSMGLFFGTWKFGLSAPSVTYMLELDRTQLLYFLQTSRVIAHKHLYPILEDTSGPPEHTQFLVHPKPKPENYNFIKRRTSEQR